MKKTINIRTMAFQRHEVQRMYFYDAGGMDYFRGLSLTGDELNALAEREEAYDHLIDDWKDAGENIFTFNDDLIRMFIRTDVMSTPINQIRLPYKTIYCHLGDRYPIPFDDIYQIDGFFIHTLRSMEDELSQCFPETKLRERESRRWQEFEYLSRDASFDVTRKYALESLAEGFEGRVARLLQIQVENNRLYQEFINNPDGFDYAAYGDIYLFLEITFTVARKDGIIKPKSPAELAEEPSFYIPCCFDTHHTTVGESIAQSSDNWSTIPCQGDRNMLARLAFNAICYLNWRGRDVQQRYSSEKIHSKISRVHSAKERQRVISKAESQGYREIYFCGYNSANAADPQGYGEPVSSHWRRGHWRNQPFGKGRASTRLTWIKPVIVNNDGDKRPTKTLYLVGR